MTKPITSVAAMMLCEEGAFELTDPVSAFIPSFADVRVFTGGSDLKPVTVPATEPVRIWHLLTHTSGLTYGFHRAHPVDAMYRAAGFEWDAPPGIDLAAACDVWAGLPLLFQPGAEWNYSVSTDVLGRVVEVTSRAAAGRVLRDQDLRPAGHDRHRVLDRRRRPAGHAVHPWAGRPRWSGWTPWARWLASPAPCSAGAAGWSPRRLTTTASPRCC